MIHVFLGEEVFLVRQALEKRLDALCPKPARDFNLDVFESASLDIPRLASSLGTLPMMAERRCVLLRNAHELRKGDMEALEPLLSGLPETTELIFVALKADNRFGFWQKLLKGAQVKEFKPLSVQAVPRWLIEQAREEGYVLSPEAAPLIEAGVGVDLTALSRALEKLFLYVHPRREIGPGDVAACVTSFSWKNVFELTDAVGQKNPERALRLFQQMSRAGESPIAFVALLGRHFRILTRVREGDTSGIPFSFISDYKRQALQFSPRVLSDKRERLFQADWALKSSPLDKNLLFERLLVDLCR